MSFSPLAIDRVEKPNYIWAMDDLTCIEFDGQKLREARGDRSLTNVARAVGISKQMLWNYENGQGDPSSDVIVRLCLFYQRPIEFFSNVKSGENFLANMYIGY